MYDRDGDKLGIITATKTGTISEGTKAGTRVVSIEYKKANGSKGKTIRDLFAKPYGPREEVKEKDLQNIPQKVKKAKEILSKSRNSYVGEYEYTQKKRGQTHAVKPTPEARGAKNELTELGESVLLRADEIYEQKKASMLTEEEYEREREKAQTETSGNVPSPALVKKLKAELLRYRYYGGPEEQETMANGAWGEKFGGGSETSDENYDYAVKSDSSLGLESLPKQRREELKLAERTLKGTGVTLTDLRQAGLPNTTIIRLLGASADDVPELDKLYNETESLESIEKATPKEGAIDLFKNIAEKRKELKNAEKELSDATKSGELGQIIPYRQALRVAKRDSIKEAMEEAGVEFDSVKLEDFGDGIVNWQGKNFREGGDGYTSLVEAFEFMPKSLLLKLKDSLSDPSQRRLRVNVGVKRGHFQESGSYDTERKTRYMEITLSSAPNTLPIDNKYTDTALHELFHMVEYKFPQAVALEHAWLYDRSVQIDKNGDEYLPQQVELRGGGSSVLAGAVEPYTGRVYGTDSKSSAPVSPRNQAYEVLTTGVQMFTAPDTYSSYNEKGRRLVFRDNPNEKWSERSVSRLRILDPETAGPNDKGVYYNPADGKYYRDSAFSIAIDSKQILGVVGQEDTARDTNFVSFVIGTLIGLS